MAPYAEASSRSSPPGPNIRKALPMPEIIRAKVRGAPMAISTSMEANMMAVIVRGSNPAIRGNLVGTCRACR
ncbi:hypothetical protein GCM10009016_34390 [Halomonas beimenensis]